jgi:uncharacterized protein YeaO (DUF488 family)
LNIGYEVHNHASKRQIVSLSEVHTTVIQIKRVYDQPAKDDGARFLVERLWPRGMKKDALHMDAWCKNLAPSADLRRWFSHDPAKWEEFQRRYRTELVDNPAACQPLLDAAKQGNITLLYSAHDTEHNNAIALKSYLEEKLRDKKGRRR